jgi:hypothetical protein
MKELFLIGEVELFCLVIFTGTFSTLESCLFGIVVMDLRSFCFCEMKLADFVSSVGKPDSYLEIPDDTNESLNDPFLLPSFLPKTLLLDSTLCVISLAIG